MVAVRRLTERAMAEMDRQLAELREINAGVLEITDSFTALLPEQRQKAAFIEYLSDVFGQLGDALFATSPLSRQEAIIILQENPAATVRQFTNALDALLNEMNPASTEFGRRFVALLNRLAEMRRGQ